MELDPQRAVPAPAAGCHVDDRDHGVNPGGVTGDQDQGIVTGVAGLLEHLEGLVGAVCGLRAHLNPAAPRGRVESVLVDPVERTVDHAADHQNVGCLGRRPGADGVTRAHVLLDLDREFGTRRLPGQLVDQAATAGGAQCSPHFAVDCLLRLLERRRLELSPGQSLMKNEQREGGRRNRHGQTERDQCLDQAGAGVRSPDGQTAAPVDLHRTPAVRNVTRRIVLSPAARPTCRAVTSTVTSSTSTDSPARAGTVTGAACTERRNCGASAPQSSRQAEIEGHQTCSTLSAFPRSSREERAMAARASARRASRLFRPDRTRSDISVAAARPSKAQETSTSTRVKPPHLCRLVTGRRELSIPIKTESGPVISHAEVRAGRPRIAPPGFPGAALAASYSREA